jgi:transcriptional repressor NrdR
MKCPYCDSDTLKVLETRNSIDNRVRRRRECITCGRRFTTYEYIEDIQLMVRKKDGRLESFQLDKIIRGLQRACEKRCNNVNQIREIAEKVRQDIIAQGNEEVPSREIGELVMEYLKEIDRIAYVRFASVYREFSEINDFHSFIEETKNEVR